MGTTMYDTITFLGSFIVSLVVALISVYFSHWIAEKRKFRGCLEALLSELSLNEANLNFLHDLLVEEEKLEDMKRLLPIPLIRFLNYAFVNLISQGLYFKVPANLRNTLTETYGYLNAINEYITIYEKYKFDIEAAFVQATERRKACRKIMLKLINDTRKTLKDAKRFLEKILEHSDARNKQ